jgi:hypothetical protein
MNKKVVYDTSVYISQNCIVDIGTEESSSASDSKHRLEYKIVLLASREFTSSNGNSMTTRCIMHTLLK